ncbi:hypothetical protein K458DRAFT_60957 [Lentithecium fluviatile CBS 122367]|uniref:Transmembrane protein n=1 Tax=Lentithecium fluviatile CBS 122367 TaxID=1168545 RepID=A0A6G1JKC8_9PLEO|nr:hypothetical protein K458DRAFT_60957 [Lentithecium fluviatile CBS 122367]
MRSLRGVACCFPSFVSATRKCNLRLRLYKARFFAFFVYLGLVALEWGEVGVRIVLVLMVIQKLKCLVRGLWGGVDGRGGRMCGGMWNRVRGGKSTG